MNDAHDRDDATARHLSEEELLAMVAEGSRPAHLDECAECRRAAEELAAFAVSAASPPLAEPDWDAQRRRIMDAVSMAAAGARPVAWWRRLRVAASLAAALTLTVGLAYFGTQEVRGPATRPAARPVTPLALAGREAPGAAGEGREAAAEAFDPGPAEQEFDSLVDFIVPVAKEDADETIGDAGLPGGGPHRSTARLA